MEFTIGKRIIEFQLPRFELDISFQNPQVERGPVHTIWLPFLRINISDDAWGFHCALFEYLLYLIFLMVFLCLILR